MNRNLIAFLSFFFAIAFALPVIAQQVSVNGEIKCRNMLIAKCIGDIHVTLNISGNYTDVTDDKGEFRLKRVPGRYIGQKITVTLRRGERIIGIETATLKKTNRKNIAEIVILSDCFSCDKEETWLYKGAKQVTWVVGSLFGLLQNNVRQASGSSEEVTITIENQLRPLNPSVSEEFKITGKFLAFPSSLFSSSPGFSVSPTMDFSRGIFTNPAAIAGSYYVQGQVVSSFDNQFDASITVPIDERFSIGLGYYRFRQPDEKRVRDIFFSIDFSNSHETLEEVYAAALAFRISRRWYFGLAAKYILQSTYIPAFYVDSPGSNTQFGDITISQERYDTRKYDFDVGTRFELVQGLHVGLSLMNLSNTELVANDNFLIYDERFPLTDTFGRPQTKINLRAAAVGVSFRKSILHVGGDMVINDEGKKAYAVGAIYQPFSNTSLHFGYASEYKVYVVTTRYRFLSYTLNRNDVYGNTHLGGFVVRF